MGRSAARGIPRALGVIWPEVQPTDMAGLAVHIGARISALAIPGEILVSSTVKDLTVGSGLGFEDRGSHELKGVPGEWRLFEVVVRT